MVYYLVQHYAHGTREGNWFTIYPMWQDPESAFDFMQRLIRGHQSTTYRLVKRKGA